MTQTPTDPPAPPLWPASGDRQQRSTELHVELGTAASPSLIRVSSFHLNPSTGTFGDRHGYVLLTPEGAVLIDPTEPTPDTRPQHDAFATGSSPGSRPLATVLTSSWHERDCYLLRDRLASPVWMPRGGIAEKEGEPDLLFDPDTTLPAGLRAITIDDRFAGDTVFSWI